VVADAVGAANIGSRQSRTAPTRKVRIIAHVARPPWGSVELRCWRRSHMLKPVQCKLWPLPLPGRFAQRRGQVWETFDFFVL
jgi:hypothetical protein